MTRLVRNQKVRAVLLQALFVGTLLILVIGGALTAQRNLDAQGIVSGFSFLHKATGWDVNFSLLPATPLDPYWWYFLIGILNTLVLGFTGLFLATLVGACVGLARTSNNELARLLGTIYVEIFRNIPLILQVFFWYAIISHLPGPRQALEFGPALLSGRGFYMPGPNTAAWSIVVAIPLLLLGGIAGAVLRGRRGMLVAAAGFVLAVIAIVVGHPAGEPWFSAPALQGLNIRGGLRIAPEFAALAIAIAIYGGAYIGEIVRGGFKSVGRGQVEAGQALGLSSWHVFSRVQVPLALRAMLPILANQYVWLIKATTMGITIGFTDFFMIVAMTINQSGQALEAILILMTGFLMINFTIAAVFNRINAALALKGNQLRS